MVFEPVLIWIAIPFLKPCLRKENYQVEKNNLCVHVF